jgi:hypothetical protein
MAFYCSVCDRELRDDERECPVCGAPSTRVMDRLEHGDEEWESLADLGRPPLTPDLAGSAPPSPVGAAPDPEWESLVGRLDRPRRGALVGARLRGWWRRLKAGRAGGPR